MSDPSAKKLAQRLDRLVHLRKTVDQQWEEIRKYVTPYRGQFFKDQSSEHSVEWKENRFIFDSTAVEACDTLAASLHGSLTSPAVRWFDFKFRNPDLKKDKEVAIWLDKAVAATYDSIRESNFDLEVNETYLDLVSYGTSIMIGEVIEDSSGGMARMVHQSVPIKECYFEQDAEGRVVRVYRKMKWSPLMIVEKFEESTNPPPEYIIERADRGDSDMDISIAFCVYERRGVKLKDMTTPVAVELRPYGSQYILLDTKEPIGDMGGYYEMPALIPRWRKTADSMWGNSPAMKALADILTLNSLVEMTLISLEKVIDPAILTTERGLLSDLDLGPGGVNILRRMDELAPFESRARFDVSELRVDKLQQSIRAAFYVDQLQLKESPAMTATEVSVRYELMQRLVGPTLGRLKTDFHDPVVRQHFNNLLRYDKLPPLPEALVQPGLDATLDISYVGPMARVQRSDQAMTVEKTLAAVLPMVEINPEIVDNIDFDETAALLHDFYDAPAGMMASETAVRRKRKDRREKQEAMEQAAIMEAQGKGAEAMKKGGQPIG